MMVAFHGVTMHSVILDVIHVKSAHAVMVIGCADSLYTHKDVYP